MEAQITVGNRNTVALCVLSSLACCTLYYKFSSFGAGSCKSSFPAYVYNLVQSLVDVSAERPVVDHYLVRLGYAFYKLPDIFK